MQNKDVVPVKPQKPLPCLEVFNVGDSVTAMYKGHSCAYLRKDNKFWYDGTVSNVTVDTILYVLDSMEETLYPEYIYIKKDTFRLN